jgi:general secretion pathway protein G
MNKQTGFTLIELMVVVVIIGIIAAIAIPNFLAMQDRAKEGSLKNNMHVLQTAVEDFNVRGGGRYPQNFAEDLIEANPAYVGYEPNMSVSEGRYVVIPGSSPPSFGNNAILAAVSNPFYELNNAVNDNIDNTIGVVLYNYDPVNRSYEITGMGKHGLVDIILIPGL